jgi:hypothetical protein
MELLFSQSVSYWPQAMNQVAKGICLELRCISFDGRQEMHIVRNPHIEKRWTVGSIEGRRKGSSADLHIGSPHNNSGSRSDRRSYCDRMQCSQIRYSCRAEAPTFAASLRAIRASDYSSVTAPGSAWHLGH